MTEEERTLWIQIQHEMTEEERDGWESSPCFNNGCSGNPTEGCFRCPAFPL